MKWADETLAALRQASIELPGPPDGGSSRQIARVGDAYPGRAIAFARAKSLGNSSCRGRPRWPKESSALRHSDMPGRPLGPLAKGGA